MDFVISTTSSTSMQQIMITTVMYPAKVQQLVPPPAETPKSRALADDTVILVAAVRRTSNIAARARDARDISSVPKVSFRAELGRPLVRFNARHAAQHRHPEHFVCLFLLQPEVLGFRVFAGATPTAESQPSCCCSVCPDAHVPQLTYRVWPVPWPRSRTADHAVVF